MRLYTAGKRRLICLHTSLRIDLYTFLVYYAILYIKSILRLLYALLAQWIEQDIQVIGSIPIKDTHLLKTLAMI